MRDHDAFIEAYPAVLGSDAVRVVVAIGVDVAELRVGDRVFFQGIIGNYDSSTFQQYCKMPAELLSKNPENISDKEASCIMLATMAVVTAFYAKEGHGMTPPWEEGGRNVGKGKSFLIIGGASSVGQYAIHLAQHWRSQCLGSLCIYSGGILRCNGGIPVDFVFDAISASATQKLGVGILQKANTAGTHLVTVHVVVPNVPDPEAKALGQSQEPCVEIRQLADA
ncbi:hypothetical protein N0V91_010654 [Didymella pomorum]|uniref:Alcohol dehydrogenase-like N-terminal domain-containing protein n=1 Tax=Didymella pomorum TaxID=749634 RepID=A0A9W9D0B8_9PLEO|nr:hypothetical protein N0V91_010654 [Didymella pomorum]